MAHSRATGVTSRAPGRITTGGICLGRVLMREDESGREESRLISRRTLVGAIAAGAAVAGSRSALAQAERGVPQTVVTSPPRDFGPNGAPSTYFWDPDVVFVDPLFRQYVQPNTPIMRLWTGSLWAEGPAWNAQGRYLVWSDIPNDRQLRYLDEDGHISQRFRAPSNESNGNTFDVEGRQISCQRTRVVSTDHNGIPTTLAEQANGKQLNGPNDVVVHPNAKSIWFTDPGYGAVSIYEGQRADTGSNQPYQKEAIYRIDAQSGQIAKVADEPFKPNGIAFSHDYKKVYVCDT